MPRVYRYVPVVFIIFGIVLVTLFVQHHQLDGINSTRRRTSNEIYFPLKSSDRGKRTNREEIKRYLINVRLSDDIPVNREIPDSRPDSCRDPGTSQLTVSVVITFYREWPSILLRTVYSVINRSHNLKEIILVDDGNNDNVYDSVLKYIRKHFGSLIHIVRNPIRKGLIGARLEGVKRVTGDVLCFLDSHMEVNTHWLTYLLKVLEEKPNAVAMSQLDYINAVTLEYEYTTDYITRYGFDWRLLFFETEYRQEQLKSGNLTMKGVVAVGSAFALHTKFFKKLGMYDPHLKVWGGENFELSFKVWLCGGELIHVHCSRIGHIVRTQPYLLKNRLQTEMHNYKRVADVWMDQFAEYVYDHYPGIRKINVSDLSQQRRKRMRCKPFSWFLNNIWPELFRYMDTTQYGSFMNTVGDANKCLDNHGHLFSNAKKLGIEPCSNDINTQLFGITDEERLRTNLQCVFVKKEDNDYVPYIQNCYDLPEDHFILNKNDEILYKEKELCLTVIDSSLVFGNCKNTPNQIWRVKAFARVGGR